MKNFKPRMIFYLFFFPIFFLLFLSLWGFWQATHPQKIISTTTPKDLNWTFEEVSIKTQDGLNLAAWFMPNEKNPDKAIIVLHGYPADKGDLLYFARFLKEDYNLLFFDFRYFGKSEGSYASLGFHERKDLLAAIDFLENRNINKIALMGFSFGASVALITLPQTNKVSAIVADSAFANLDLMGKVYFGNLGPLHKPLMTLAKFWAQLIYQIDADKIAPEQAIKNLQTPIFIIHSRQDEVVLVENAYKLKDALSKNKNAQFWIYDRGVHGDLESESYQERILQFLEKHLN